MANTKISQLPLYTGSTTDGYIVFNNSGETTTYKYKVPLDLGAPALSPFQFLSAGSSSVKLSGTTVPSTANASSRSMFIGNMSTNFVGTADYSLSVGDNNAPQTLNYPGSYAYQFGQSNGIRGGGAYNSQFGSSNATNANGWCYQFGNANNAENGAYQYMFGSNQDASNSYVYTFGYGNVINTQYSAIFGLSNTSTQSGGDSPVRFIHGYNNTINGTSRYDAIIAGNSNTITDKNYVVMLGTSGRTAQYASTTHMENTHIYGVQSFKTLTGNTASGAVTVDLSQGSVYGFDITGSITSLTFTNWREGASYDFVVYNTGSYTITSSGVTLGGVSNTVAAKGGTINPTNNAYTHYRLLIVNGKGLLMEDLNYSFM